MPTGAEINRMLSSAVAAWRIAAERLGIAVIAPARVAFGHEAVECVCFLPHFGGKQGMLVGWHFLCGANIDQQAHRAAKALGVYYSSPNLDSHCSFSEEIFIEALTDWGYFGPEVSRPKWLLRV